MSIILAWLAIGMTGFLAALLEEYETGWVMPAFDMCLVLVACIVLGPVMYPFVYRRLMA